MHPRSLILTVGFCCFAFQIERAYGQDQKFEKGQTVVVAVDEATVYRGKNAVGAVRKGSGSRTGSSDFAEQVVLTVLVKAVEAVGGD